MVIIPDDSSSSSDTNKWAANVKDSGSLLPVPFVCFDFLMFLLFFWTRDEQHDPPPSYLDTTETITTITSKSTPGTDRLSTIPNIKPSNYVNLNRANESIKGSWLIDPSLSIPESFLPPPPTEGARSNVILESKNGAIDADIYLLSTSHSNKNTSKFIVIQTQSNNGSVRTRLVGLIRVYPSVLALVGIHNTFAARYKIVEGSSPSCR